jgi:hypothetical protein
MDGKTPKVLGPRALATVVPGSSGASGCGS